MGLDVYLYHKGPEHAEWRKKEQQYEEESEANWKAVGGYEKATEAQKKKVSAKNDALCKKLGLGKWGGMPEEGEEKIEMDSKTYPECYCKIGYFRSSYNSGGMNSVLENLGVPNLYDIFPHGDEYEVVPDWELAKEVVAQAREQLKGICESDYGKYMAVEAEVRNPFDKDGDPDRVRPTCEKEAMDLFVEQLEIHKPKDGEEGGMSFDSYSNWVGSFFLKGWKLFGHMGGKKNSFRGEVPVVYLIMENEENYQYYQEALFVVEETIDYVLAQDDPENYYFHWSG